MARADPRLGSTYGVVHELGVFELLFAAVGLWRKLRVHFFEGDAREPLVVMSALAMLQYALMYRACATLLKGHSNLHMTISPRLRRAVPKSVISRVWPCWQRSFATLMFIDLLATINSICSYHFVDYCFIGTILRRLA